jgi:hypothetical protein
METIEVRYSSLGGGYYHKYLVYNATGGLQYAARGGPELGGSSTSDLSNLTGAESGSGGGYGSIITNFGSYDSSFIDFDPENDDPRETVISGTDLSLYWAHIQSAMMAIESEKHEYRPYDQNSNTTVDEALRRAGVPEPMLDEFPANWAPGSGNPLSPGGDPPPSEDTREANLLFGQLLELHGQLGQWTGLGEGLQSDLLGRIQSLADRLHDLFGHAQDTVSPLILDLDGDGVETVSIQQGVLFDHDGNGLAERTGWAGKDDGLLVWDRNGNGQIDSGRELFGNNAALSGGGFAGSGFAALADLDGNHDGRIDIADGLFSQLRVWKDTDSDGHVDAGELLTLDSAGVQSLSASFIDSTVVDANANEHRQRGQYTTTGGATRALDDVWFSEDRVRTINTNTDPVTPAIAALPEVAGLGTIASLHQAMLADSSGHLQIKSSRMLGTAPTRSVRRSARHLPPTSRP